MKRLFVAMALAVLATPAFAWNDRYEIERDLNNANPYGTDIEMRKPYDYNPSHTYRGTRDNDGSTRLRNSNGDTVRGDIDSDGSGRLHDQNGNIYRVRPR